MTQFYCQKLPALKSPRGTLLLLHGWGFDHQCWRTLLPFLQQEYDVLLVDLPGFGASAPLSAGCADTWLEQTLVLLERQIEAEVGVGRALSVVGWSLGGQLALRLLQRDSRIHAALGIATNLQFCANSTWSAAMDAQHYADFLKNFSTAPVKTLKNFSRLVSAGDVNALSLRKILPSVLASFDSRSASNWTFALQSLQLLDHTQAQFERPVLLLLSDNDALVPASVARATAQKKNVTGHCLAQASHGHLLSDAESVAGIMLSFLHEHE